MRQLLRFKIILLTGCLLLFAMACKKKSLCDDIVCGSNSHCEVDTCLCNTGWAGSDCGIPMYAFVGNYHVIGMNQKWVMGAYDTTYIDDTIQLTSNFDTLLENEIPYAPRPYIDTSVFYFRWDGYRSAGFMIFHKSLDDSLFYESYGSIGSTYLKGKKI